MNKQTGKPCQIQVTSGYNNNNNNNNNNNGTDCITCVFGKTTQCLSHKRNEINPRRATS